MFRNIRYCLTRLGFGLNVAPMIMKSVVSAVIDQDELVKSGTSAYVDDIFVDESVVSLDYVKRHFLKYGLESKEGEQIGDNGVRVLGLCVRKVGNKLMWSRAHLSKNGPNLNFEDQKNDLLDINLQGLFYHQM